MQYVALLRGINVGGHALIKMADLQSVINALGFKHVQTYIQSGNVIFETAKQSARKLETTIEQAILKHFHHDVKVVIHSQPEMARLLKLIPKRWYTDSTRKYNVIFLRHTVDSKTIMKNFKPKPEIETVAYYPGVLLWSANINAITRSTMIKLAGQPIYKEMTVRNLNTTKKIYQLMVQASN